MVSASHVAGATGSCRWMLRLDPETVRQIAVLDWNRVGRRVWIDVARGIVSWMTPSYLHGKMGSAADDVVVSAGLGTGIRPEKLRDTRWKRPEDPPNAGLEPDASYYVGEQALAFRKAMDEGRSAEATFIQRCPPDLVVEINDTHADPDKPHGYARLGVGEMWLGEIDAEGILSVVRILDLRSGDVSKERLESFIFPGLSRDVLRKAFEFAYRGRMDELEELINAYVTSALSGGCDDALPPSWVIFSRRFPHPFFRFG